MECVDFGVVCGGWPQNFHAWIPGQGRVYGLHHQDIDRRAYLMKTRDQPVGAPDNVSYHLSF